MTSRMRDEAKTDLIDFIGNADDILVLLHNGRNLLELVDREHLACNHELAS